MVCSVLVCFLFAHCFLFCDFTDDIDSLATDDEAIEKELKKTRVPSQKKESKKKLAKERAAMKEARRLEKQVQLEKLRLGGPIGNIFVGNDNFIISRNHAVNNRVQLQVVFTPPPPPP